MSIYSRRSARRSLIDTVLFRCLSQAATIAAFAIMIRAMSEAGFGVYSLLYSFIPVVSTVASLGLEQVLRRYQPEFLHGGNRSAAHWLVRTIAATRFGVNAIVIAVLLLTWNHLAPLFHLEPYRGTFIIFAALVLLHFQAQILQLALASHMLHRFSVGAIAILSIGKLAAYAVLAGAGAMTVENAILADIGACLVAFLFLRAVYRRHCIPAEADPYRPEPDQRKRMVRYGLFNNFNDAGTLLMDTRTDNFFIAAFLDPVSVGIYAFYTRLNEMAGNLLPIRLFDNVIQPMLFSVPRAEAARRLPQYFTFILNSNLLLQWPMLAFCIAYHADIVTVIFGGKFIGYSWLLPMVMSFSVLTTIGTAVTLVAQYKEKAGIILTSKVFAIYNVVALLLLLPALGLYGAALARGSGQAMKNAFIWWHVRGDAVWLNVGSAIGVGLMLWAGAVALCMLVKSSLHAPVLVHLMLGGCICAVTLLLHLRSPAIGNSDRQLLASLFHGVGARHLRWLGLVTPAAGGVYTGQGA